nr:MAG TPA: hypothetical protein [Caudoviricetes sp.]
MVLGCPFVLRLPVEAEFLRVQLTSLRKISD